MKKAVLSSLMVGALALSTLPTAAQANSGKALNPWQDCGLGAMIFPENGVAAAISNVIWDLGTTAVTSNISSQDTCASSKAKTAMFIKATMPSLEQDIAVGEGEYVTAMLELRGCEATSHNEIIDAVRQDYAAKPAKDAEAFYHAFESRIDQSFVAACPNA